MPTNKPSFYIEVSTGPVLFLYEELWPDGDGPENPTEGDVRQLIAESGGPSVVIEEWGVDYNLETHVYQGPSNG